MKKIITIAIFALMPTLFYGQAAFDKYEGNTDVTSVIVNKKAFSMLGSVKTGQADEKTQEYQDLIKRIESFKVFVTEKPATASDLKNTAESYAKSANLEELMRVTEKGMNLKIMVKSGKKETQITEILMFVESSEKEHNAVVMSVIGNFDLDELSELIGKALPSATEKPVDEKLGTVNEALALKVSPNPVSDVFQINTTEPAEIKIYDLSGRLIRSESYKTEGVSVSGLNPATYVVEITIGSKKQTQRIIVK